MSVNWRIINLVLVCIRECKSHSFSLIYFVQIPHYSSNEKNPTIFIITNNLICHPFCFSYYKKIGAFNYIVSLIMLTIVLLVEVTSIVD